MKKHILMIIFLAAAVGFLFLLAGEKDKSLSQIREQYAAASALLDEKNAELEGLSFGEADALLQAAQKAADQAAGLMEEASALDMETGDLLAEANSRQEVLTALEEEKAYYLEVYHALREGYEKVLALISGN